MKIKKGYILREINDKYLVAATGKESKKFDKYILLNSTSAFLWKILEKGAEASDLLKLLQEEYDIDEKDAINDINEFINLLKGAKIIE